MTQPGSITSFSSTGTALWQRQQTAEQPQTKPQDRLGGLSDSLPPAMSDFAYFRCGSIDHAKRDCPQPARAQYAGGVRGGAYVDPANRTCHKCGETGASCSWPHPYCLVRALIVYTLSWPAFVVRRRLCDAGRRRRQGTCRGIALLVAGGDVDEVEAAEVAGAGGSATAGEGAAVGEGAAAEPVTASGGGSTK